MLKTAETLTARYKEAITPLAGALGISNEEQIGIIYNLVANSMSNDFFTEENLPVAPIPSFEQVLIYLEQNGLSPEEIKELITKSPQVLLFCEHLDDIYLVFKGDEYRTCILVDDNEYRSYSKDSFDYMNMLYQDIDAVKEFPNLVTKLIENTDDYKVETILNSTIREDVAGAYGITETDTIKEVLEKMKSSYSEKNFYVKGTTLKQQNQVK